jgi:hypothetical protein
MAQTPLEFYLSRINSFSNDLKRISKVINIVSFSRLVAFLLVVFSVWAFTTSFFITACFLTAISVIGLFWLVKYHLQLEKEKLLVEKLLEINQNELACLGFDFSCFNNGEEFLNPHHPFTSDLDIFGGNSLFQYINRTVTDFGKKALADRFVNPEYNIDTIKLYQEACKEISAMPEWRQQFQAVGALSVESSDNLEGLYNWMNEPPKFLSGFLKRPILLMLSMLTVASIVTGIITGFYVAAEILFTAQVLIIIRKQRKINLTHEGLGRRNNLLKQYSLLLGLIEQKSFQSAKLINAKDILVQEKESAASQIKKLSALLNAFDRRYNFLAKIFLNILYMHDIWNVIELERWKVKNKSKAGQWFGALGKFDVYISLGNFAFNNPDYVFPEFNSGELSCQATSIGHPLIDTKKRVCNDFVLPHLGYFVILTGANMAGKSTFLRTIGVNMILGMAGAPVCATGFEFLPIPIMTSISVKDSLSDNESYFYAELKRLKMIVDELNRGTQVFIILDEILKGTNSNDKMNGSKSLLKQFLKYQSLGIIATHDISLGDLEFQYPENIKNKSFEVAIEGDRLFYDYKLQDGACKNLNASYLMKKMGIILD